MVQTAIIVCLLLVVLLDMTFSVSTKIAFGSCAFPGIKGEIFKEIAERKPDLFIWNGDITYIDHQSWDPRNGWLTLAKGVGFIEAEAAPLSEWPSLYDMTKQDPNYQLLLDTNVSITGTYDDHDYGKDNAFGEWPHKDYAQRVFLDFLDVAQDDPKRDQEGIYEHVEYEVKMEAANVSKIIDIILLDIHYFARLESTQDILGSTQWSWLYNVVQNETHGELLVIVTGLQILPVGRTGADTWGTTFAESQRELFQLLLKYNTNKRVLILSGDLHRGETLQAQCINQDNGERHTFYEMTSSGLTHGNGDVENYVMRVAAVIDDYLGYDGTVMCRYKPRNFGLVDVAWEWNADLNDFEIGSVYSSLFDINGKEQCSIDVPLWNNSAPLDYEVDDSKFILQTFGDYKCYGAKKQYPVGQSKTVTFKYAWMYAIIFTQFIAFVLFYLTTVAVAIVKCAEPSSKCVKWMNRR